MNKYRIVTKYHLALGEIFIVQKRIFLFFWAYCGVCNSFSRAVDYKKELETREQKKKEFKKQIFY